MNHPRDILEARYKVLQLQEAAKVGFKIPDTIVTNDSERARQFSREYGDDIVIKALDDPSVPIVRGDPVQPGFIYTTSLDFVSDATFERVSFTPCLLQRNVPKDVDLRVTVVGTKVFSAAIDSQIVPSAKTDWRVGGLSLRHDVFDLPDDVKMRCLDLTRRFNLPFAAIDLIRDDYGDYVFVEVNPNGEWEWLEETPGLPIAEAIANELAAAISE